jgi:hypothetical protein
LTVRSFPYGRLRICHGDTELSLKHRTDDEIKNIFATFRAAELYKVGEVLVSIDADKFGTDDCRLAVFRLFFSA